ncbi:MAG: hypothetical protein H6Q90_6200 [Deltaproteobacteria bacterium]|nr:hypothetical protein [Deltaproteobacteria bacterium]
MRTYLASTLCLFTACSGSNLDPGSGNDPGGGTSTLVVDGNVHASPRIANAASAADFDTEFSVRASLNGLEVTTGTVQVTSASGTIGLVFQPDGGQKGRWTAVAPGYDEVYILDVVSGADEVTGVRVDGPDIHAFTDPLAGATVDSTLPLPIAWSCGDTADVATIRAEQVDNLAIADTGTFMLPSNALKAEADKPKENTVRLVRTNRVTPAGAVGISELSVGVENELDLIAQPAP